MRSNTQRNAIQRCHAPHIHSTFEIEIVRPWHEHAGRIFIFLSFCLLFLSHDHLYFSCAIACEIDIDVCNLHARILQLPCTCTCAQTLALSQRSLISTHLTAFSTDLVLVLQPYSRYLSSAVSSCMISPSADVVLKSTAVQLRM
jgi:hypothetical protein